MPSKVPASKLQGMGACGCHQHTETKHLVLWACGQGRGLHTRGNCLDKLSEVLVLLSEEACRPWVIGHRGQNAVNLDLWRTIVHRARHMALAFANVKLGGIVFGPIITTILFHSATRCSSTGSFARRRSRYSTYPQVFVSY